ncbi:MAG: hypothetical protein BMS9Abin11_1584 [Gammaproteobacteria bacterium]|nr:MAG: hypothetical protein BMS9Abin11_1584 [Gammaproteobacteria bacterium]
MTVITMYLDIFTGIDITTGVYAYSKPTTKTEGSKRFAFDIEIPDKELFEVDVVLPKATRIRANSDLRIKRKKQ